MFERARRNSTSTSWRIASGWSPVGVNGATSSKSGMKSKVSKDKASNTQTTWIRPNQIPLSLQSHARGSSKPAEISKEAFVQEVLNDYRIAFESRQASLIGRKEVLTGKAKFGIFGDGKEIAQLAMAKVFQPGDWRSGYYRDQTFMFAKGMSSVHAFLPNSTPFRIPKKNRQVAVVPWMDTLQLAFLTIKATGCHKAIDTTAAPIYLPPLAKCPDYWV